jgi:hypothetical protein
MGYFLFYCSHSIPLKQAGNFLPEALWWATQAQPFIWGPRHKPTECLGWGKAEARVAFMSPIDI